MSLKVIFDLAVHLESLRRRASTPAANRLVGGVSTSTCERYAFDTGEKLVSFGYGTERHSTPAKSSISGPSSTRQPATPKAEKDHGGCLLLLRDTLVGLLYVHYAPPGAQILYTNPLFARSHDFIGIQGAHQTWKTTEVLGNGWPSSAGGRLVGSLSTLPYALAEAEQNFLIPTREQALIWGDLVPQMLVSAKLPRWWNVTPGQIHYLALHLRLGEEFLAAAATSPDLLSKAIDVLDKTATPVRLRRIANELSAANVPAALEDVTPAEVYSLGRYASENNLNLAGGFGASIAQLAAADPERLNHQAISDAFGTPKPTLANTMHPQLLNLRTFPTLMGFSSRIMAESWESNNIFFAALADRVYRHNVRQVYEWSQTTSGVPHARALVMKMLETMSGGQRLAVEVTGDSAADCGAIAVRRGDDLHLLLYNHRPLRKPHVPEQVSLVVEDARFRAGDTWRLSEQLVDAEHGVWSYAFEEDCRAAGLQPDPKAGQYEGAISLSYGNDAVALFGRHKAKYAELAMPAQLADQQPCPVQNGRVTIERDLGGHSVRWLKLSPAG